MSSTDLDEFTCKIPFSLWRVARRMSPTHPCMQEAIMPRRTLALLITLTLALLVAPLAAEARRPTHVPRIGVLLGTTPGQAPFLGAFLEGMRALGYVEGQNLVMEYRGAAGQYERLPALAAELAVSRWTSCWWGVRQRRWPPSRRPRRSLL